MEYIRQLNKFGTGLAGIEGAYNADRPTILIYASCHGRTLVEYFKGRPDLMAKFNLFWMETGPITLAARGGSVVFESDPYKKMLGQAEVVVTYNMGARMGRHALNVVSRYFKKEAKVITFTAPNFSALWPLADGYGANIAVDTLLDKGVAEKRIWEMIQAFEFDPMFDVRWRIEMGRMVDKDRYHDIGLTGFIGRNVCKVKLFTASTHPSFILMAHVGSEVCRHLGLPSDTEEKILQQNPMRGALRGQPETRYEWDHYKLSYPMRYHEEFGGWAYYKKMLGQMVKHWKEGAIMRPWMD